MMKYYLLILIFIFSFLGTDKVYAQRNTFRVCDNTPIKSIVGTIQSIDRNIIKIYDERDREIKRFVYFSQDNDICVGQRVRVYYDSARVIQMIKKMTPVSYKPQNGKNFGYIMEKKDD